MLRWELRKPSIVGIMASVAALVIMLTYTFITYPSTNPIGMIISLVLNTIVFATMLLTVSLDVQWLEIFSVPKFQKWISILIIVIAIVFVIGMILVSQGILSQISASDILLFVIAWACIVIHSFIEFAQREIGHNMN